MQAATAPAERPIDFSKELHGCEGLPGWNILQVQGPQLLRNFLSLFNPWLPTPAREIM